MKNRIKYLLLLPLTAIVSCGYSTSYLVEGNKYVSAIFNENYYKHWDKELESAKEEVPVDLDLDEDTYIYSYYFGSSSSLKDFGKIDYNYFDHDPDVATFGEEFKMGGVDDSFRYGYQSKLFDGQMVCGAQSTPVKEEYAYQKGRVQISESGFSIRFSKESNDLHYFAMQFKASTDNTREYYKVGGTEYKKQVDSAIFHESLIKLTVTLYLKVGHDIVGYPFELTIDLTGLISPSNQSYKTNNGHYYTFIAFDLEKYKTDTFAFTRLVGVSVGYEVLSDALIDYNKNKGVDIDYDAYALFLYEMFFPYTSWN